MIFRIHRSSILEPDEMGDLSLDFSPMLLYSVATQKTSGVFCIYLHCESSEKLFIIVVISLPKSDPSLLFADRTNHAKVYIQNSTRLSQLLGKIKRCWW